MQNLGWLFLLLVSSASFAKVDAELSGNLEAQGRHSWNNPVAKEELFQTWEEDDFFLYYGNLNGKVEFASSRIEANWFVRHTVSDLYRDDYLATRVFTFPRRLVARDVLKL